MRKGLLFLMGIVSFLGINTVSADTTIVLSNWYDRFEEYIGDYNQYKDIIDYMISYWEDNLSDEYPYYAVIEYINGFYTDSTEPSFHLTCSKRNFIYSYDNSFSFYTSYGDADLGIITTISYDSRSKEYSFNDAESEELYYYGTNIGYSWDRHVLVSNSLIYDGTTNYLIPSYTSETLGIIIPEIELTKDSLYPGLIDLYDGSYISNTLSTYKEINLNDFPYIALSLKDYNTIPDNNYSTYSNLYVKGQLCITPVYNYGMTERKDILTGTQIQRCSTYYNDFTTTRMYLLKNDVENHAIYYLKAYDTTKDNIIKVDSSVFDISYITEDSKDNPYVSIGGKQYPTIAYDKLTDTATKSEDEDYNSGVSCPVGDFNCYNDYNSENIFDSIFDSPLKILKNIWSSITSVFDIITEFIMLLPETMQSFLFLSFMIAIILGLIKIIL